MPIYEYRCESCGGELEKIQKVGDPALKECPACGEAALVKLVSASAFRLKGGGWYETDFKKGNRKNVAGENQGAAGGGAADSGADKPADKKIGEKVEKPEKKDKAAASA